MVDKTPKGRNSNDSQKVLKSIQPQEQIVMNITKQVSGSELGTVLQGVDAFAKCFSKDDKYSVEIKVEKVIEPDVQDSSAKIV